MENAIGNGAKVIVCGGVCGGFVTQARLAKDAFYRPTLLELTDCCSRIVQREVFGPVLTMQVFDTEAEAISLPTTVITAGPPASGRAMWTALWVSLAHCRPGLSGSTIGPSEMTRSKRVASSKAGGVVCAAPRISL